MLADATRARLSVLAAAVLWSTAGAAIKNSTLSAWQIAGGRALFAALFFAAVLPGSRRGWDRRTLWVGAAYAATTVLFVWANTLTTAANAIFLQDVAPLWVILLSPWLLSERPTRGELCSAPFYLGGTALFFVDELAPGGASGNAIALVSGVTFALLILGLRRLRGAGAEASVLAGNVLAVLACLPLVALDPRPPAAADAGIVVFLGTVQLGVAYLLFLRGLRGISAVEGSLLALIEPVLSPVWAFALAAERPGPWAILGGLLILGTSATRVVGGNLGRIRLRSAT